MSKTNNAMVLDRYLNIVRALDAAESALLIAKKDLLVFGYAIGIAMEKKAKAKK